MTGHGRTLLSLNLVSGLLLAGWAIWWTANLIEFRLVDPGHLSFLVIDQPLGGDFGYHTQAARTAVQGGNPWGDATGYTHPPAALPFFLWCALVSERTARTAWMVAIVAILVGATVVACRQRVRLGLERFPLLPALVLVLFASPVLFEIERGQVDVLVLALLGLGWLVVRQRGGWARDSLGGLLFGLVIAIKLYPFFLLFGLAAARRVRLFLLTLAALGIIVLCGWKWTGDWMKVNTAYPMRTRPVESFRLMLQGRFEDLQPDVTTWKHSFRAHEHSISGYSQGLLCDLGLPGLARVPGIVFASLVLVPLCAWLSLRQFRTRNAATVFPLLAFLTLSGSYLMPLAFDYGLCLLPLVTLAVWDRRDPWPLQICVLALLLYLFPLRPDFRAQAHILFQLKFFGFVGTALMLARRMESRGADAVGEFTPTVAWSQP